MPPCPVYMSTALPTGGSAVGNGSHPSDPFCTPLSVAVEQRLNPVEQHVAVQPPS